MAYLDQIQTSPCGRLVLGYIHTTKDVFGREKTPAGTASLCDAVAGAMETAGEQGQIGYLVTSICSPETVSIRLFWPAPEIPARAAGLNVHAWMSDCFEA